MSFNYFYPKIGSLIPLSKVPDDIQDLFSNIQDVLNSTNLRYKDLIYETSYDGDSGTISITIIPDQNLGFTIGGAEGLGFLINSSQTFTEIPVSLYYEIPLLKYTKLFDPYNFTQDPANYLLILARLLDLPTEDILAQVISVFHSFATDPIQDFIYAFNHDTAFASYTPLSMPTHDGTGGMVELLEQIEGQGIDFLNFVFQQYISIETSISDKLNKIEQLFFNWLGNFDISDLLNRLLPTVSLGIDNITLTLEFPISILKPVDPTIPKSKLTADIGSLSYYTNKGIVFTENLSFTFTKSEVLNTGLILSINGAQFDFRNDSSLPVVNPLGYSGAFKGFYAAEIEVDFPDSWNINHNNTTAAIKGTDIVIGREEDLDSGDITFSGNLSIQTISTGIPTGVTPLIEFHLFSDAVWIALDTFGVTFRRNVVTECDVTGQMSIKGLKDSSGNDAILNIAITYSQHGYDITFSDTAGIELTIPYVMDITLYSLTIGSDNGKWKIGMNGKIVSLLSLPVVDKILPAEIDINKLLFEKDTPTQFDIKFKWDGNTNATLTDAKGFDFESRIDKTFLDVLKINLIKIHIQEALNNSLQIKATVDGNLLLGPLNATVKGVGIQAVITEPSGGGNLGPFNLTYELVPPKGIGLSIDESWKKKIGFSGGGVLVYDKDKGFYFGGMSLSFKDKFSLKAVGMLVTKLPGGESGYSLLIIISVSFNPGIPIGLGFEIQAVGGLLGLHRTIDSDVIRNGLKSGSTHDILFPDDPVKNASSLISLLSSAFPVKKDQFVFGPLAEIVWGQPKTLVYIELGLMIEISDPFRLLVMGTVKAILPKADDAKVSIKVAFIGEIDFTKKQLLFDASIYDSKIGTMSLSGDMLVRLFWGEGAGFLLSVGGFHPNFVPPPMRLPKTIKRLTVSIINTNDFKLGAQSYFAITSNTIQFGSSFQLWAQVAKSITLDGHLAFDALVYFKPNFQFLVAIDASLSAKYNGKEFSSLHLTFNLQGPGQWHVWGDVKFSLVVSIEFKFDKTFGTQIVIQVPPADVFTLVLNDLGVKSNWEAVLDSQSNLVTYRALTNEQNDYLLLQPLGGFQISQKIAPLNVDIQKYGDANISGANKYQITRVTIGGSNVSTTVVKDQFAPAEFFNLNDSDKLSSPSFINYASGVSLADSSDLYSGCVRHKSVNMDTILVDRNSHYVAVVPMAPVDFNIGVETSTTAKSGFSNFQNQGKPFEKQPAYEVTPQGYVVVQASNLSPYSSDSYFDTYHEAANAMNNILAENDMEPDELTLVLHS